MRLVLLGDPVEHSLSPVIQQAALDALGIAGTYTVRRVDAAGLRAAVDEVRYGTLAGANVTMPHKHLAFTAVDDVAETALATGAVNTITHRAGSAIGANTDVAGVLHAWNDAALPQGAPALILGSGGAAGAALVALAGRELVVAARRAAAAHELITAVRAAARVVPWGEPVEGAVVVNATPLGMAGETLPDGLLESATGLLEMPYASGPTPAERRAAELGLPAASGTAMLLGQAMASFATWTGRAAPQAAMAAALAEAREPQAPPGAGRNPS